MLDGFYACFECLGWDFVGISGLVRKIMSVAFRRVYTVRARLTIDGFVISGKAKMIKKALYLMIPHPNCTYRPCILHHPKSLFEVRSTRGLRHPPNPAQSNRIRETRA